MPTCALNPEPKVKVFTKPGCPQCKQTKRWLHQRNINFEEHDVTKDAEAYNHVTEDLGYWQAPVVEYNGEHWSGFSKEKLECLAQYL